MLNKSVFRNLYFGVAPVDDHHYVNMYWGFRCSSAITFSTCSSGSRYGRLYRCKPSRRCGLDRRWQSSGNCVKTLQKKVQTYLSFHDSNPDSPVIKLIA
jgi:hypothetical protein